LEVLVEVVGETTFVVALPDAFQERLVEEEQVVPVLKVRGNDHLLLSSVVCNDRVVDVDTLERHIRVISSDEGVGNVRDVVTAVALTSEVEIPALDTEGLNELLVEANELLAKLDLVDNIGCALSETNADRLLNPHHVGKVDPSVGVLHGSKSASLPCERTVLSEQATERAAARTAIEPNGDLLLRIRVGGREEPEEELARLIGVARDRQKTSVALSNVERNVGESGAVHDELLGAIVEVVVSTLSQARVLELLVRDSLFDDRLGSLGLLEGLLSWV
jgi:hypothetical protein